MEFTRKSQLIFVILLMSCVFVLGSQGMPALSGYPLEQCSCQSELKVQLVIAGGEGTNKGPCFCRRKPKKQKKTDTPEDILAWFSAGNFKNQA